MNLTDKARRGSQEAMEALFDMTKKRCCLPVPPAAGGQPSRQRGGAPHLPQPVGAGARRAHHHRGGLRPGRPGENSGFLQNRPRQKGLQVLPHPPKPGFRPGDGGGAAEIPPLSPPRWRSPAPRRLPARAPPRPRRAPPFPKAPLFPRTPAPPKPPPWTAKLPKPERKASLRAGFFAQKILDRRPPVWLHKKSMAAALPPLGGETYGAENTSHHRL